MKFSKPSQLFLVSRIFIIPVIGLVLATLLTACQLVTIDYVFVADSAGSSAGSAGQIQTFAVDSESGALRQGQPTVSSGGVDPVSMAVTGNFYHLYVANAASKNVVHFAIATNGVLTSQGHHHPGRRPRCRCRQRRQHLSLCGLWNHVRDPHRVSDLDSNRHHRRAYRPDSAHTSRLPRRHHRPHRGQCAGQQQCRLCRGYDSSAYNPGGTPTSSANPGWVFGFAVGSGGALTATSGSPYKAGVKPSAITSDPVNRFVYVTDFASNELIGYAVQSTGSLNFLVNGPFKTGNQPTGIVVDPRGHLHLRFQLAGLKHLGLHHCPSHRTPSAVVNTTSNAPYSTDTQPVAITVDPALGRFVYTVNHLGNSVSGFRLNPNTGVVTDTQATPYPTGANPTALAIVPHGNHSVQSVTP